MVFILSLFMADSLWGYLAATVVLAAVIRCSRVPFKFIVKGLKAVVFLLLISEMCIRDSMRRVEKKKSCLLM